MQIKTIAAIIVLFAMIGFPAFLNATVTTFSGQDNGVYPGPFTSSASAQSSFTAAAGLLGPLDTITFENLTAGYYTSFTAAPGVTVTVNAPNAGSDFSGIVDHPYSSGSLAYGFNITPSGSNWFGFPGTISDPNASATFNFANPTQSFGMYLTGLQTLLTASLTISFFDGTPEVLSLPVNAGGGAQYFGFTDPGAQITSITITNNSYDAWGIDDVTYNSIPVPPALWLFGSGLLGLMGWRRFRNS